MLSIIIANVGDSWFVLRNKSANDVKYYGLAECVDEATATEIRDGLDQLYYSEQDEVSYGGTE